MTSIVHVVGTRPQFVKCAPVWRALDGKVKQTVVHTGQHYDDAMSKQIIEDTGCHIDGELEPNHFVNPDDLVVVYGDCEASLIGAHMAMSSGARLAHVEAGLRCGDMRMREEAIRREIDSYADVLYAPSEDAVENLRRENVPGDIGFVGNVMADTWRWSKPIACPRLNFGLVTMHRAENVDDPEFMREFMDALGWLNYTLIFPKHPRVRLPHVPVNVVVCEPMRYREFIHALLNCQFVITDSGGVQEEATLAHTPCLTMRPSTERPVTIWLGTNELTTPSMLQEQVATILAGKWKHGTIPPLWDGHAAERIAEHLCQYLS